MTVAPGQGLDELDISDLPLLTKVKIARKFLSGLESLHATKHAHLDLKPAHVFLEQRGDGEINLTLLDLNLAARFGTPVRAGNKRHLAPELANGPQPAGVATDLYGFGILFFTLFTGKPPFEGKDFESVFRNRINARLRSVAPEAYGGLSSVFFQLLRPKPLDRPTSAAATARLFADVHFPTVVDEAPARTSEAGSPPLVGREEACAQFESWLADTNTSQGEAGGTLVLAGPNGVGKRRLVKHWENLARLYRWSTLDRAVRTDDDRSLALLLRNEGSGSKVRVEIAHSPHADLSSHGGLYFPLPSLSEDEAIAVARTYLTSEMVNRRVGDICLGHPGVLNDLMTSVTAYDDIDLEEQNVSEDHLGLESTTLAEGHTASFFDWNEKAFPGTKKMVALLSLLPSEVSEREIHELWRIAGESTQAEGTAPPPLSNRLIVRIDDRLRLRSIAWRNVAQAVLEAEREKLGTQLLRRLPAASPYAIRIALELRSWRTLKAGLPEHIGDLMGRYLWPEARRLFAQILSVLPAEQSDLLHPFGTSIVLSDPNGDARNFPGKAAAVFRDAPDSTGRRLVLAREAVRQHQIAGPEPSQDCADELSTALEGLLSPRSLWDQAPLEDRLCASAQRTRIWAQLGMGTEIEDDLEATLKQLREPNHPKETPLFLGQICTALPVGHRLWDRAYSTTARVLHRLDPFGRATVLGNIAVAEMNAGKISAAERAVEALEAYRLVGAPTSTLVLICAGIEFENGSLEECRLHSLESVRRMRRDSAKPEAFYPSVFHFTNMSAIYQDVGKVSQALAYQLQANRGAGSLDRHSEAIVEAKLNFFAATGDDESALRVLRDLDCDGLAPFTTLRARTISEYRGGNRSRALEVAETAFETLRGSHASDLFELLCHLQRVCLATHNRDDADRLAPLIDTLFEDSTARSRILFNLARGDRVRLGWDPKSAGPREVEQDLRETLEDIEKRSYGRYEWQARWNLAVFYGRSDRGNLARDHWTEASRQLSDQTNAISDGRVHDTFRSLPEVVAFWKEAAPFVGFEQDATPER